MKHFAWLAKQSRGPFAEVLPGPLGHAAHRLVPEDGLQNALGQDGRASRDPHLSPGQSAGVSEDKNHEDDSGAIDPQGQQAGQ